MRKSIKKLDLNKRTIANLNVSEMNEKVGGVQTNGNGSICVLTKKCFSYKANCPGFSIAC